MAVGIHPGTSVLTAIHESDHERTLLSLQGILNNRVYASRVRVQFRHGDGAGEYLRMNLVRSAEDENAIDGYLEREDPAESLLSQPWLGVLLERLEVSYTLIDRNFEIVDFNSRSNEYAVAVLGQPLTIGQSILSYASEDSKPLLVADLEHAFSGREIRREWSDEADTDVSTFSFMHIPLEGASGAPSLVAMCTLDLTNQRHLENRQRELAVAVAQSPISVVITDPDGTITYVNPFFEELTGYSATEVLGKNPRILQSDPPQPITDYAAMWQKLSAGKAWSGEFLNLKKNGDTYRERALLVPITSPTQEVTSIVGLKEDITELTKTINQLEEKEEHFRSLFDNAAAAIYIHDTSGIIREVNPMASMQTGYPKDELIGMHVGQLDVETVRDPPKEVVQLLEKNPEERVHHVAFETTHRRKDGTEFPAEVTLFPFSSRGEQLIAPQ